MLESWHDSSTRVPYAISGFGVLLGLTLVCESGFVIVQSESPPEAFYLGVVTSSPFILGLVYGGYWIVQSDLVPDRYDRIARWWGACVLITVVVILTINSTLRPITPKMVVGTVRWSAAIGGGIGLLLGVYHAQAIQWAIETERARLRQQELQQKLEVAQMGQALCDIEPLRWPEVVRQCWETGASADATLRVEGTAIIFSDRDRLQELFDHLFQNAIEHGGDAVTVDVGLLEEPAGFYVEDDGPGIPSHERKDIREVNPEDDGMGLVAVDQVVSEHGWTLTITESKNGGARFEITGVAITDADDHVTEPLRPESGAGRNATDT